MFRHTHAVRCGAEWHISIWHAAPTFIPKPHAFIPE
jgi:hypothetical protein